MRNSVRYLFLILLALTMWSSSAKAQEGFGLQLVKLGSPVAQTGGSMSYSLFIFNNSLDICTFPFCTVILEDQLPAGFILDSVTAIKHFSLFPDQDITGLCSLNVATNELTCDLGSFLIVPTPFVEILISGTAPNVAGLIVNNANVDPIGFTFLDGDSDSFETNVVGPGPQADLFIFKTDSPDPVIGAPGNTITYTLAVGNAGPDDATGVVIQDALPAGTTFVSSVPGGPACNFAPGPNAVNCNFPGLPAGNIQMVTITVNAPTLAIGAPDLSILNIARIFSNEADPSPGNNIVGEATTVVAPGLAETFSDLVITKTAPATVILGGEFFYTVQIFNVGPDTADNVRFRDAPFMGTTINLAGIQSTEGPPNCAFFPAAPNFRCDLLNPLAPGQSVSFIVPATYNGPTPINPQPIFNVANVILGPSSLPNTIQVDPETNNNTFVNVTNVVPPPPTMTVSDLVITKAGADIVLPGEEIAYSIEVTNLGPDTAQNVIVRDIIPQFVTFNSFPGDCDDTINPGELICNIGDLANGEVRRIGIRAEYNGPVPALPLFRPIFNLAHVDFGPTRVLQIDPETADNTVVALTRAIAVPPSINFIDLFLVKTDSPDPVVVEEELTYNLNVYNFGPNDAVGVVVTDTLPPTVTNIDAPPFCAVNINVVTCLLPNPIPANGGVAIIPITATAPTDPGMILNAAQTFADPFALLDSENIIQIDFAPSNNTDSEKTTVVPVPPPMSDLLILKTDTPDPVIEGELLTYTIFVKNTGPDPAAGVLVSDWLPKEGLDLTTVTFEMSPNVAGCIQDPDGLLPPDDEPFKIECFIPSLGVEESATITVKVETLPLLPDNLEFLIIFNLAKVESIGIICPEDGPLPCDPQPASADKNPHNNVVVESTLIGEFVPIADLLIIKSDSPDPVIVNNLLTYVLFISNSGPDPATGVTVTDTLPASVNFVSAIPDQGNCGVPVANALTCNLGNLGVGEFTQVTVLVRPTVTGTILNVAQVEGIEHDPKSSNNISPQTTTVESFIPPDNPGGPNGNDLFVLKFVSPDPAQVGDEITYTIIVGNNGEFSSGGTLVDTLPSGVTLVSANIANTGEACPSAGNQVTCALESIPSIGSGQVITIEIVVRADQTGTIANLAFIDSPSDPIGTNNVSIAASSIVSQATNPPPTNPPTTTNPGDLGGSSNNSNSSCTLAVGKVEPGNSAFNFAILLLPLFVFGIRSIRRKK